MIHTNDMKKYFILLALISLSSSLLSQQLEGNYKEKSDSLSFSRGKVSFSLSGFGALVTRIIGEGSYELVGDYLLIDTHEYPGEKSAVQILDGVSRDSVTVKVLGPNNYPLQGALLEYMSESGNLIIRCPYLHFNISDTVCQPAGSQVFHKHLNPSHLHERLNDGYIGGKRKSFNGNKLFFHKAGLCLVDFKNSLFFDDMNQKLHFLM
jgi:hypothetical protein